MYHAREKSHRLECTARKYEGKDKASTGKGAQIKRRVGDTQMSALESLQVQGRLTFFFFFNSKKRYFIIAWGVGAGWGEMLFHYLFSQLEQT